MRVTYWAAKAKDDAPCYNIRMKTKKAILAHPGYDENYFEYPVKIELEYSDVFDLVCLMAQEGGPGEVY